MLWYKYMHMVIAMSPQEIIDAYNILLFVKISHILVKIRKGMYAPPPPIPARLRMTDLQKASPSSYTSRPTTCQASSTM